MSETLDRGGGHHLAYTRRVGTAPKSGPGMADPDVPWEHALKLMARLGPDTHLTLLKDGDHRLSKPHEIAAILRVLESMLPAPQSC